MALLAPAIKQDFSQGAPDNSSKAQSQELVRTKKEAPTQSEVSKLNLELNFPQRSTNMTSINEFFPGRFFKAETLAGKARVLRIAAVEREKLSDGSVKPVVSPRMSR